jgi:hypothetical protein
MSKKPVRKVQITLTDSNQKWPYVGNALENQNGSLSLFLDKGVKLVLADGTVYESKDGAPVKLYVKPARPADATAEAKA